MSAQTINTISEFMLHANTQYRVYDMGRGIEFMDTQKFIDIESNLIPVPCPRAGCAWFAVVFWNKQLSQEQYIWFVKLPIDERSLIVQAARNQFLETVVTALGTDLEKSAEKGGKLPENPFIFKPSQQQLADINALIRRDLQLPARSGLSLAVAYLQAPNVINWQNLALQDIADLAAHIERKDILDAVNKNICELSVQVLTALCSSFENCRYGETLTTSLIELYRSAEYAEIQHMVLRGLKGSECKEQVSAFLLELLQQGQPDTECLVVIAGRHFRLLADEALLRLYLSKLIESDPSCQLFNGVYTDLVQVPETRSRLLRLMHQPDLPESIAHAIASLYQQVSSPKSVS